MFTICSVSVSNFSIKFLTLGIRNLCSQKFRSLEQSLNLPKDLENGLEKAHLRQFGTLKIAKNGLENLEKKPLKMASKNCGNPDKKCYIQNMFFYESKV